MSDGQQAHAPGERVGSQAGTQASMDKQCLNTSCFCISLDAPALRGALIAELGCANLVELVEQRCPYLFSARPVFLAERHSRRMAALVHAVEAVVATPAYRERILAQAPAIARHDPGAIKGVFFGYDFHVQDDNLQLIEINTNAGGAMLNAVMARAHESCCLDPEQRRTAGVAAAALEGRIVDMFFAEWTLADFGRPLQTIAIVDVQPQQQYLYAEFLLFQKLFERNGLQAVIVDPSQLTFEHGVLLHDDVVIDLVYNRLTDFMLAAPSSAALRSAYLENAVVLTPHPQAHALYADKRNLAVLCDPAQLDTIGVPPAMQAVLLANIPHTEIVTMANAERLWRDRRRLFFKPTAGYGGRAAYRGDKLTKRVWEEILAGQYVAQAIVRPGERIGGDRANPVALKFDIRSYAYHGAVQWTAARVYQGQTTNFRTPGGGFAPVYSLLDVQIGCNMAS